MPGFFDFTDFTQPMSPAAPSLDNQGWGGDLMQPQQPIVPESYDIFGSGMPQMPQQVQGPVPYDALGAMAGIQMPEIPQQDDMGRYGITDGQRRGASNQSLAAILMGAGKTLFNDRPDDVMAAAAQSGDIRRGALDKASLDNVNAFKLKADAEAKKLDMISRMSDIQRQQLQIESEKMKLDDLKMQRAVAVEFGREMAPVAEDFLKRAATMYPDKVPAMRLQFLVAKEKLASGDLAGADIAFNAAKQELLPEWQKEMEEQMIRKSLEAGTKYGIGLEMSASPELQAKARAAGGVIEADATGAPSFVSQNEIEMRKLRIAQVNAQIASSNAQAQMYRDGGRGGASRPQQMTPNEINSVMSELAEAAGRLGRPKGDLKDQKAIETRIREDAEDTARFKMYGITPESWFTTDPSLRKALINNGGQTAPQVGPEAFSGGGGQPIPAAQEGLFIKARGADVQSKRNAITALANSGDPRLAKLAQSVMSKYPRFSNKEEADKGISAVYDEIFNQLRPQTR